MSGTPCSSEFTAGVSEPILSVPAGTAACEGPPDSVSCLNGAFELGAGPALVATVAPAVDAAVGMGGAGAIALLGGCKANGAA